MITNEDKKDFIHKVYDAYKALGIVTKHKCCKPGVKGLREELLMVVDINYYDMMEEVFPKENK